MAVILMVQVHILELFAKQEIFDSPLGSFLLFLGGPPAAPVFMAVMGYFVAKSNSRLQENIIRGVKLIGLGLFLNAGLNFHLFIRIFDGSIDVSPWPYLFGADILFMAGLSIIVIGLIRKTLSNNPLGYFLLILLIFFIGDFFTPPEGTGMSSYIWALFFSNSWWSYFPLIPWLAYPLSGVLFFIIEPRIIVITINKAYLMGILVVSGIILVLTINYGITIASDLHIYYHHSYLYLLFVWNFMIFWTGIMSLIAKLPENKITSSIQWMGKNVTVFYIIQWLIIGNIATALYKTQSLLNSILWFVGILLLTSALTILWKMISSKSDKNKHSLIIK